MKKMLACAAIIAAAVTMTGCISVPGVVMDKTKPIEQGKYTVVSDAVSSTVYNVSIFGIPLPPIFADSNDSAEMASNVIASGQGRLLYRKALGKAPGADALIEHSLDSQYGFFFIFAIGRTTLTGTAVKTNK